MNLSDIQNATRGKFETQQDGVFVELELSKVYANPNQPRLEFANIEELAETIKEDGLLQPIVVVKDKDSRYMVIAGERRYRAHVHINKSTIRAHIIVASEKKVQELAFVENIQRDDLTDFEKAKYINTLWASGHYASKKELAQVIGKSQSYLSKAFKAVKICDAVVKDLEESKRDIGLEVLQALSSVKDEETQIKLYKNGATREEIRDVGISPAKKEKRTVNQLLEEIDDLQRKELYIVGYHHKRGHPHGGGYRVRAFNRDESLALGREHYEIKKEDKNYIFEARTLKELEDSCENGGFSPAKFKWNKRGKFNDICDDVISQIQHMQVKGTYGDYRIKIEEI